MNHEHGDFGAVFALVPYLIRQKSTTSCKARYLSLAPNLPCSVRFPLIRLRRKVITRDNAGSVKTGQRYKEKLLLAPPVRGKGTNVVRCQTLQLSAAEIVDVEFIFDVALVGGHQPIVTLDRHVLQLCFFVFGNEVLAEVLDMSFARL